MANGQRQRGGAQLQRSSTLDTIEQIARIGGYFSDSARDRKKTRDAYTINFLGQVTDNYESVYSQNDLSRMLLKLDDYKSKNAHKMSVDSLDLYSISRDKVKRQMDEVTHYDSMIKGIDALPNKSYNIVNQISTYDLLPTDADKKAYAEKNWASESGGVMTRKEVQGQLETAMIDYSSYMRDFFGRHGERVNSQNPYLAKRYRDLQDVFVDSVDAFDDGLLSKGEADYLKKNLIQPDGDAIKSWANRRNQELEYLDKNNRLNIKNNIDSYRKLESQLNSGFVTIEGVGEDGEDKDEQIYVGFDGDVDKLRRYYENRGYDGDNLKIMMNKSIGQYNAISWNMENLEGTIGEANDLYVSRGGQDIAGGMGFGEKDSIKVASSGVKDVAITKKKEEKKKDDFVDPTPDAYTYADLAEDFTNEWGVFDVDNPAWLNDEGLVTTEDKRKIEQEMQALLNGLGLGTEIGKDLGTALYRLSQAGDYGLGEIGKGVLKSADILGEGFLGAGKESGYGGKKKGLYWGDSKKPFASIGEESILYNLLTIGEK